MQYESPLDTPSDFAPSDADRPAGTWMEGYWAQTAPWARAFGLTIGVYFGWLLYQQFQIFMTDTPQQLLQFAIFLGSVLLYSPIIILGYFGFQFGHQLKRALQLQDQLLLEKAFQHLYRFILTALVLALLWVLYTAANWYTTIQMYDTLNHLHQPTDYQYFE